MSKYGAISVTNEEPTSLEEGGGWTSEITRRNSIIVETIRGSSNKAKCVSAIYVAAALASVAALFLSSGGSGNAFVNSTSSMLTSNSIHLLSSSGHHHHKHNAGFDKTFYRSHDPNKALWYKQTVDHFADKSKNDKQKQWDQRYYVDGRYFKGPGHPIFLVIGGEGTLEGMLYPFINDHLAKKFGAFVVEPEHRFYGESQPVGSSLKNLPTTDELVRLLTPQQAMEDMLAIAQHYRFNELGCSPDEGSIKYCPVISVGGSYPGFLSAMMRLVHPEIVDIAYAASAPLLLYSQSTDQYGYYEIVSSSAEKSAPGCAQAVKTALMDVVSEIMAAGADFASVAERIGLCKETIPEYIDSAELFAQESMMIVEDTFADANMDKYVQIIGWRFVFNRCLRYLSLTPILIHVRSYSLFPK